MENKKLIRFLLYGLTFVSVACNRQKLEKEKLSAYDYRLFSDTNASKIAESLQGNDSVEVRSLVNSQSIDLNFQEPKYGKTLLMLSIMNRQYEICKFLLSLGANPNVHDSYDGASALIEASGAYTDKTDIRFIDLLIKFGADINDIEVGNRRKGNTQRNTPLINASGQSLEKVKILVEAGAKIDFQNEFGVSALSRSIHQDNLDIVLYLLNQGANFRIVTSHVEGKDFFLWDELRYILLPLDSEDYKLKLAIIDFLASRGIEYRKIAIPESAASQAKDLYPNTWEDYLTKY